MDSPRVRRGAALEYTERILGGPINEADSAPATTSTASQILNGSGDRVAMVVVNTGNNDVIAGFTPAFVQNNSGIRLFANGGSMVLTLADDFTLPTRPWFAASPLGASSLYIIEYVRFSDRVDGKPSDMSRS